MKNSKNHHLIIEIFQNGHVQFEKTYGKRWFPKKLKLGPRRSDDLILPFSLFHKSIDLFSISQNAFSILIDPRFDGFITSPDGFGRIADLVTPKGSLTALASSTEPRVVPLKEGSRGCVKINGYDILFKVEKKKSTLRKTKTKKEFDISREIFPWPTVDSPWEKWSPVIGCLSTMTIFCSVLMWSMKAPFKQLSSLEHFPSALLAQFIAPDHFRYLPAIYGERYNEKAAPLQVYYWVEAVHKRWNLKKSLPPGQSLSPNAKRGFPIIDGFKVPEMPTLNDHSFGLLARKIWEVGQQQTPPYLKIVPMLLTLHSGGSEGSLTFRQEHYLKRLQSTYKAINAQILTQHEFLKDQLLSQNAKIHELFELPEPIVPPAIGNEPPEIDGEFLKERLRFQNGESWAKFAEKYGIYRQLWSNSVKQKQNQDNSLNLSVSLGVLPLTQIKLAGGPANPLGALEYNLDFSTGYRAIPPPPRAKPTINMQDVALVLFGKREQMRMCYEISLRRNPRMAGDVQLGWTVRLDGRVSNIKPLRTQIRDGLFLKCLEQRLESWRFPKPVNGPVYLKHTFGFVSQVGTDQDLKD